MSAFSSYDIVAVLIDLSQNIKCALTYGTVGRESTRKYDSNHINLFLFYLFNLFFGVILPCCHMMFAMEHIIKRYLNKIIDFHRSDEPIYHKSQSHCHIES